ncbi:MAG: HAMP domain-containing sensor histidine kinase [Alphaproteobacteria bacterium]|nr:HAMP domain-containing sensor histidine kinase [Alphaproteobacteria bacterium]
MIEEDISSLKEAVQNLKSLNQTLEGKVAARTSELVSATRLAQEANAAKSEFLARMSHDLRTPLNAIIGFSEVLSSEETQEIAKRNYTSYGHDIHTAAKILLGLVDDLLDLSRIEAGQFPIRPEPILLPGFVEETLSMVRAGYGARPIELDVLHTDDLRVVSDRRALMLILNNLISNAVKFTPSTGRITITLRRTGADRVAQIDITDTGDGISPDELETIFTPYARGRADVARRTKGTGLGLTICKSLADLLLIDLSISSEVTRGTTVSLKLPNSIEREPSDPMLDTRRA